jgi:hypothetical protein
MDFEEEMLTESALISGEVILDSLEQMLGYYPLVLGASLRKLSELLDQPIYEVLAQLEEEQGLVGVLESSNKQLSASKEVLGSFLDKFIEEEN